MKHLLSEREKEAQSSPLSKLWGMILKSITPASSMPDVLLHERLRQEVNRDITGLSMDSALTLRKVQGALQDHWAAVEERPDFKRWNGATKSAGAATRPQPSLKRNSPSQAPVEGEEIRGLDDIFTPAPDHVFRKSPVTPMTRRRQHTTPMSDMTSKPEPVPNVTASIVTDTTNSHVPERNTGLFTACMSSAEEIPYQAAPQAEAVTGSESGFASSEAPIDSRCEEFVGEVVHSYEETSYRKKEAMGEPSGIGQPKPRPPESEIISELLSMGEAFGLMPESYLPRTESPVRSSSEAPAIGIQPEVDCLLPPNNVGSAYVNTLGAVQAKAVNSPMHEETRNPAANMADAAPTAQVPVRERLKLDDDLTEDISTFDMMLRNNQILSHSISSLIDCYFHQASLEVEENYY